jgi:hypothetical protein
VPVTYVASAGSFSNSDAVLLGFSASGTTSCLPLTGGTLTGELITNGQVTFPAIQNPSANANTLDDYEEGTFTPVITFGGGSTGITYTVQEGYYTKIGNRVFYDITIVLSAKGSSTGTALITGLPFTSGSSGSNFVAGAMFASSMSAGTTTMVVGQLNQSNTTITMIRYDAGSAVALTDASFTDTSSIRFNGHYRT